MERNGRPGVVRRVLGGVWRGLDRIRQVSLNLLFIAVVAFVAAGWWAARPAPLPTDAALVVAPVGHLVEQRTVRSPAAVLQGSDALHQVLLRDVVDGIRAGAADGRIKALVIETDSLSGAGLSKLQEIAAAVGEFRKSGKRVYAYGKNFNQFQYHLAAQADEVFLNPDGYVLLSGMGRYPTYFKGLLDQAGIKVQVFRVGNFKSAVEPYTRSDMSPEDKEATRLYLNAAWEAYLADIALVRPRAGAGLASYVSDAPASLAAAGGDSARMALKAGLVDGIKTVDEWRAFLKDKIGADVEGKGFKHVELSTYIGAVRAEAPHPAAKVGIIVAQGAIMDGEQPSGVVGGDTLAALVRQAREDDSIKAVVLRVDSPGGSATASELIRRELEVTRTAGKPVVVSMSSVAASGGYWISMAADEVWANPTTITGSIGIFAMLPDLSGPLNKFGVTVDGIGTTPLAAGIDPRRPLEAPVAALLQQSIEHGYKRFLTLVGQARKLSVGAVDQIGQGRVWLGSQAKERGLVDQLGGLEEAITAAGARAGLKDFDVIYVEKPLSPRDQLLSKILETEEEARATAPRTSLVDGTLGLIRKELEALAQWNDPGHVYLHCQCVAP